jgi:hypothetical protein
MDHNHPPWQGIIFNRKTDGVCHGFSYLDLHSTPAVAMVQTIGQRYKGLTQRVVKDAIFTRKAQAMTGHPSNAQFQAMVRGNTVKNCPIKPVHITNAHSIFGPSIARVCGKTICHKPMQIEVEPGHIPSNFHRLHKLVVLTAGIMFVNGIIILTTLSCKLWLATIKQLLTQTAWQLNSSITKTVRLYACTGFIIKVVMMDQEFDEIEDNIEMVEINTTATRKHIGKIK